MKYIARELERKFEQMNQFWGNGDIKEFLFIDFK